ncbi:MAG: DUF6691 family protein [Steroidobacteraceae bacterium]
MGLITALVAGLLFGAGLLVSGMANPAVVQGFLDVAGHWNPALAFTMGGAILVAAPAYRYARSRGARIDGGPLDLPSRKDVDADLVVGAAVFGLGWGLCGICPGPALLLLTSGQVAALVFVAAMCAGLWLASWRKSRRAGESDQS